MADTLLLRTATRQDAAPLARLVDIAGEGMPSVAWADMADPGETIWQVGERRAARESGAFSYRNATIIEQDGKVAAAMVGYPLEGVPDEIDVASLPPMFQPLQHLENKAPYTLYINVLATFLGHRRQGFGKKLIKAARQQARAAGYTHLSLIVQDTNPAQRLYTREGFRPKASRPIITQGAWRSPGRNWLLMMADA